MLRCAVIGLGTMGSLYAQAFEQANQSELAAIVDLDGDRVERLRQRHPSARAFSSVDEMLEAHSVDAVAVALPDFAHREATVQCLQHGLHVLCEKPLAMSMGDARAILEASEASSGSLMVNFGNRHRPSFRLLREEIQSGSLGEIQSVSMKAHERVDKTLSLAWRGRTTPTWFLVSHAVDLVMWLLDSRFRTVYGIGSERRPDVLTDVVGPSSVWYLATLDTGATFNIGSTWALPTGFPRVGDFTCEVIGTKGAASLDVNATGLQYYYDRSDEINWEFNVPNYAGLNTGWWHTSCSYFLDCVERGVSPEPSARQGMEVVAVLSAMSESIATGRVVDLEGRR